MRIHIFEDIVSSSKYCRKHSILVIFYVIFCNIYIFVRIKRNNFTFHIQVRKNSQPIYEVEREEMQIRTSIAIRRVPCHNRYTSPALPTTFCIARLQTRSSSPLEPRRSHWASLRPPTSPCSHPPPINSLGSRLGIVFRFGSVQFPRCTLETF